MMGTNPSGASVTLCCLGVETETKFYALDVTFESFRFNLYYCVFVSFHISVRDRSKMMVDNRHQYELHLFGVVIICPVG